MQHTYYVEGVPIDVGREGGDTASVVIVVTARAARMVGGLASELAGITRVKRAVARRVEGHLVGCRVSDALCAMLVHI